MNSKSAADWDKRYREHDMSLFGDAPNEYLRMVCARSDFAPQTVLLPADGDGRNGAWLARRGMSVTAFDLSTEAMRLAQARDKDTGVDVERFNADIMEWRPGAGRLWDAVAILYLQGPAELRQTAILKAIASLAPDGWLVLEGFARVAGATMGPKDAENRYAISELETWTKELKIIELMAGKLMLDEGDRHKGHADVVRLAARKR
ncbi:MAG: class I SAM-dependent methyltransferase [Rhodobiaceae bacterium]|nr:class I SAM-dependent methyltransferase [Rhodobiaceae bacterium]